jgi:uncharacterized protein YjdB
MSATPTPTSVSAPATDVSDSLTTTEIALEISELTPPTPKIQPYCMIHHDDETFKMTAHSAGMQKPTSYTMNQIKSIYRFPNPSTAQVTVAVISFGGSLVGTLANGVLTNGDPQAHWLSLGIQPANHPRVLIVPVNGARIPAIPNTRDIATIENTLDVETVGALCPTSNLTIILYIANPWDDFPVLMNAAMNPTTVNGRTYTPSIISCSWGTSESNYYLPTINANNSIFRNAVAKGITITAATGDYGSSNGTTGTVTDFPSSSPHVLACGGTTLLCPNSIYDSQTVETAWTNGGGGISKIFAKPDYQSALPGSYRSTPDIVMVADPDTGIVITIGNAPMVIGGTSFVSPAMAAFTAALNLKQALTPLLYTYPSTTFHDITVGSNGAYFAGLGFDHCTGRGSINGTALVASIQSSINPPPPPAPLIPVTGISLTELSSIYVGQSTQLTATIAPINATNKTVKFTSSNISIVTVNSLGIVTGNSAGNATITATTIDGGLTASVYLTVIPISVAGVLLTGYSSINVGQSMQIISTVQPANATNKTVTYSTSNPAVATIAPTGIVLGVSEGITTIIATTVDGGKIATLSLSVISTPVVAVLLSGGGSIAIGSTLNLKTTLMPPYAQNKEVSYKSSNNSIATVSTNGVVKGISTGAATITVTTVDGNKTSSVLVTVAPIKVASIILSTQKIQVRVRGTSFITATVIPSNAANKNVMWISTNPQIATVTPKNQTTISQGIVVGVRKGRCTIIATTKDGNFAAMCNITVV